MNMLHDTLPPIGRRRASRLRVSIPAWLDMLDGKQRVALSDLSLSGAHVRTEATLRSGSDGVLSWLQYEVFGKVVWSSPGQAGIEFYDLISSATLLDTRKLFDHGLLPDEDRKHYENMRAWYQGNL